MKNIDKTRNYFHEIIEQNELMIRKHKEVCTTLNYIITLVFKIKKVKNTVSWTYVISDLNEEEIVRTFYEKGL